MKIQITKKTLYNRRLSLKDLEELKDIDYPHIQRPKIRAECQGGFRPCPFVSCRYHLYLDITYTGSIQFNFNEEPWEIYPSCALDIADEGDHILDEIGDILHICCERVRQIEAAAISKLKGYGIIKDWRSAA